MKAYTFVHSYVCGIQVGIQAGHALVELMNQDEDPGQPHTSQWASHHKTFVWLDGGGSSSMLDLVDNIADSRLVFASFRESEMMSNPDDPLDDGMLTAVSVVLPTEYCDIADSIRMDRLRLTYDDGCTMFVDSEGKVVYSLPMALGNVIWKVANSGLKRV